MFLLNPSQMLWHFLRLTRILTNQDSWPIGSENRIWSVAA